MTGGAGGVVVVVELNLSGAALAGLSSCKEKLSMYNFDSFKKKLLLFLSEPKIENY